jgi:arsenate reductase
MGCNVVCPFLDSNHEEDWGLEDPSGKSDEEFIKVAETIEEKVKDLARRIENNEL